MYEATTFGHRVRKQPAHEHTHMLKTTCTVFPAQLCLFSSFLMTLVYFHLVHHFATCEMVHISNKEFVSLKVVLSPLQCISHSLFHMGTRISQHVEKDPS